MAPREAAGPAEVLAGAGEVPPGFRKQRSRRESGRPCALAASGSGHDRGQDTAGRRGAGTLLAGQRGLSWTREDELREHASSPAEEGRSGCTTSCWNYWGERTPQHRSPAPPPSLGKTATEHLQTKMMCPMASFCPSRSTPLFPIHSHPPPPPPQAGGRLRGERSGQLFPSTASSLRL